MTAETLSAAAGLLLSLALSYAPGLAPRYQRLSPAWKRLVLLGLLLLVAGAALAAACAPRLAAALPVPVACSDHGAAQLAAAFLAALVANQAAFTLTPRGDHQRHRSLSPEP
jgi:hypothetical protein